MQVSESMALLNVLFCWLGAYIAVRRPGKRCGASRRIKKSFKHVIGTDRECNGCKKLHGAISTHAYYQKCIHSSMHCTPIARQSSLTNSSPLASCPMWPIFRWGSQYPSPDNVGTSQAHRGRAPSRTPFRPCQGGAMLLSVYRTPLLRFGRDHVP
jgi:hypothetical protein